MSSPPSCASTERAAYAPPAWARAREGEVVGDRYRLESVVGHGAMGAVFRATDAATARVVAVKVLAPPLARREGATGRFLAEARWLSQVRHESVPACLGSGVDPRVGPFVVSEFVRGETLLDAARGGPMGGREALGIGVSLAEALAAAHREGVIHRDVKPSNVMVAREGGARRLWLLDFGVARCLDDSRLTASWEELGTPQYMAPEQRAGARDPVSPATDLYALGRVLAYLLGDGDVAAALGDVAGPFVAAMAAEAPTARPAPAALVARTLRRLERSDAGLRFDGDGGLIVPAALDGASLGRARALAGEIRRRSFDQARFDGRLGDAPEVDGARRAVRVRAHAELDAMLASLDATLAWAP